MSDDTPTTSFDVIEEQKENILPIASGRSARALAASLSPLSANPQAVRSENYARQADFECELETASELDDPLDVWVRYVSWTLEAFPSGNSSDSQLTRLLERATRQFVHDERYQNDVRYLRLWIQYAQGISDAPKEVFAYLARHEIGQKLALFYEEYAALLESLGRRLQASEIYVLGLERAAQPVERLQRKHKEFLQRSETQTTDLGESSSPVLPSQRPVLATKSTQGVDAMASTQTAQPHSQTSRPTKEKIAVFSDAHHPPAVKSSAGSSGGWESIGSLQSRKKENTQEPRPWAGEVMKQQNSKKMGAEKLNIFRDSKKNERMAVEVELLYPDEEDFEFCFEELQAMRRGFQGMDWDWIREEEAVRRDTTERNALQESARSIKVKTVLSPSPSRGKIKRKSRGPASPTMTFHTKAATDEIYSLFNQPLHRPPNTENATDTEEDSGLDSNSDGDYTSALQESDEPSQGALHGAEAGSPAGRLLDDDTESAHSEWSEYEATGLGLVAVNDPRRDASLGGQRSEEAECGAEDRTERVSSRRIRIPSPPEDFDPPRVPYHVAKDQFQMQNRLPYMTPIVEKTESFPPTVRADRAVYNTKTPSRTSTVGAGDTSALESSMSPIDKQISHSQLSTRMAALFVEPEPRTCYQKPPSRSFITDTLCNPLDESLRRTIFQNLDPPLTSFSGYYHYLESSTRGPEIRRFCKSNKRDERTQSNATQAPCLRFTQGLGATYSIRKELGKGAFAPVYLVETSLSSSPGDMPDPSLEPEVTDRRRLEALKMEQPPTPWEFYIMRQARVRLRETRIPHSIAAVHELHLFLDEGFLILDYLDQGTILDLVNSSKADLSAGTGSAMEEIVVMFFAIELLRAVEGLHSVGIIHGDLKPDNCLVRFEFVEDGKWLPQYQSDGSGGWSSKGISFIDFGRGIDMTLFPSNVQFIADWKTDQQDCAEMREMRPWTHQVDYHGLASIIYTMLFGKYIETAAEKSSSVGGATKRYTLVHPLKRYWQQDIWSEMFEVLLNPLQQLDENEDRMPINRSLRKCRQKMEGWLEANCDKGSGLKNLIRRMESRVGSKLK